MTILFGLIIAIALITHLYLDKENSTVSIGVWKAFVFGMSYCEGNDEEGEYAVVELFIGFVAITLTYNT